MFLSFYKEILGWTAPSTNYLHAQIRCCKTSDHMEKQKERAWAFYDIVELLS